MAKRDLSSGQVAAIIGVCPRKANQYVDSGEIPGYRLPAAGKMARHRRVPLRSVVEFCLRHSIPMTVLPGYGPEYAEVMVGLDHQSPPSSSPPPPSTAVTVVPVEENFS